MTWPLGKSGTAFQRVVDLCIPDAAFSGKDGIGLLCRSTIIKKLAQRISFFSSGSRGEQAVTGSFQMGEGENQVKNISENCDRDPPRYTYGGCRIQYY